jgi:hypothetical protein
MSLVGALNKIGAAYKKSAPFHSAVDEALANLARQKGTGPEFLRELSKTPGVKPAELSHRKLDKILQSHGKITKEDVLKLARENPPPKLYESVGQDLTDKQLAQKADEIAHSWGYRDYDDLLPEFQRQVDDQLEKMQAQYGDYKLPGGENYREIKMRLPHFSDEDNYKLMELEANQRRTDPAIWNTTGDAYQLKQLQAKKAAMGEPYLSSHWQGEPNVLAHMRVSDRTGPEGQKVLHVEEIQSDWHQAGRSKGYADAEERRNIAEKLARNEELTPAEDEARMRYLSGKMVPDAPFKKNWHELAMKRLLNYAADNGYDSIAITPGAEQAKRYNLSSHVDELLYKQNPDGTYQLSAQARGSGNMLGQAIPVEKLEDYVGKEVAQKIIDNRGQERNLGGNGSVSQPKDVWGSLSGEGLEIGGEGMKGFYDQMLPAYLNQFGKKYGTEVGAIPLNTPKNEPWNIEDAAKFHGMTGSEYLDNPNRPELEKQFLQDRDKATTQLHHFPITPEMREEIATKGFPLYRKGGTVNIEQEYKLKKLRK